MLDASLKDQLQTHLQRITHPVALIATLDEGDKSRELLALLQDIANLSEHITLSQDDAAGQRTPSFTIQRAGSDVAVRFAGIPMGHEFTSLVLALLHVGGHAVKLDEDQMAQVRALEGDYHFEVYVSLSCQNCPDVVQALNAMAVINPRIRVETIDGALFQEEVDARAIQAVPTVYLNGELFGQGRSSVEEILGKLDHGAATRTAEKLNARAPYDLLVVGGGPAGAAAAVYAARKGIRTGVVAERVGGQVLDTLGIENFISVQHTEGPQFAVALEQHVRAHDVDLIAQQKAQRLQTDQGLIAVALESGAVLRSKTVILATGARWREVNVPGEREYRNHGVAYCPHCDGPLFKGKRVAVIGGGNSGVEAAIDLAGLAAHVTLIEFDQHLRADAVLQRKLHTLANVTVVTHAQTTEITGDGKTVNGLVYKDRTRGQTHNIALEGVFVQIGLTPNTEWLDGAVQRTRHGEIEVDAKGQTSLPGVFAAGDATTVPYKQIVIAAGDGAKAALGAFDYLIRQ